MPEKNHNRPDLRDLTLDDMHDLMLGLGEKPFRARQVMNWLYKRAAASIEDMTDLSKDLRSRLARAARLDHMVPAKEARSADGTCKMLFEMNGGVRIESVLIPEADHSTLCVSTQAGCRQGCAFCRTATLGFRRNLTPAEITGQVLAGMRLAEEARPLTNLVFMGMGEPLDNLDNLVVSLGHILGEHGLQMSQRRVTVSTVGLADKLPLLAAQSPAALAVSLNAPTDEIRDRLMPVNRRFPLAALKQALLAYPLKPTRRITLEYVLLAGVNDQPGHAKALIKWVHGLRCKVNLIPFNPFPGARFDAPEWAAVEEFQERLAAAHLTAMVRRSRGADIDAACGMLAGQGQG